MENAVSKVGGGKVLHSQAREVIHNVLLFMKNEAEEGLRIPLKSVHERVAAATGISKRSLIRIAKEGAEIASGAKPQFVSPKKNKPQKSPKSTVDDFDVEVIRRTVHQFHTVEKRHPTLRALLPVVREQTTFDGKLSSLRILMKRIGFKWKRTSNNKSILCEKYDIRLKRMAYLRKIMKLREEGRPIIFTDETYVHSSHTTPFQWTSDDANGLKAPVSKGQRLIVVHAGGEMGFISGALLLFKSGLKTGDYHGDMNNENYMKWLENQLIPNLPPNSVVVLDNASYHNVQYDRSPSSSARKEAMKAWLDTRGVEYATRDTKIELLEKIKRHRGPVIYQVDRILAQHGHSAVRLPPYHPELNPIEKVWGILKNWVALHNVSFKMDDVKVLVQEKCAVIGQDEWWKVCENVKKVENCYIENEMVRDEVDNELIINLTDSEDGDSISECDDEFDNLGY